MFTLYIIHPGDLELMPRFIRAIYLYLQTYTIIYKHCQRFTFYCFAWYIAKAVVVLWRCRQVARLEWHRRECVDDETLNDDDKVNGFVFSTLYSTYIALPKVPDASWT